MAQSALGEVLRFIHTACAMQGTCDLTDRELLERFLSNRDESAFTFLVRRHGPTILGVCRRLLGDAHEAEDVFQATFLVLVRRARYIRRKESVGSWLYGVAQRISLRARAQTAARRHREGEAGNMAGARSVDDVTLQELRSALDEEIGSLPEKYRAPIVLCHLEGNSYDQAARELRCAKTSLVRRLNHARDMLRQKLVRRGITLTVGALATSLSQMAAAAPMPVSLTIKTVKAGALVAAGKSVAGGCLSAGALALANQTMIGMPGIKGMLVLMLTLGLVLGGSLAGYGLLAEKETPVTAAQAQPPALKDDRIAGAKTTPGTDRYGDPLPEGASARLGTVRFNHGHRLNSLFFLPDGKTLVSEGFGRIRVWDAASGKELRQFSTVDAYAGKAALSADGRLLTLLSQESSVDTVRTWDLAQGKEVSTVPLPVRRGGFDVWHQNAISPDGQLCAITLPKQIRVFDSANGKELFTLPNEDGDKGRAVVFAGNDRLVTADKKHLVQVWDARTGRPIREFAHGSPADILAASADGARLVTLEHHTYAIDRMLDKDLAHVWDLNTGTQIHAFAAPPKSWYMDVRFSADGKILFASSSGEKKGSGLTVWDLVTGNKIHELVDGYALAASPDGSRIATGWHKFNLVDMKTGRINAFNDSRDAFAGEVFLSPTGDRAHTVGYSSFSDWDAATGNRLHTAEVRLFNSGLPHPRHSPDGRYALFFEGNYSALQIIVWDVIGRKRLDTLRPPGANQGITTVFSPDSSVLATHHQNVVRIWSVATGKELRSFNTKPGWWGVPYFTGVGKTLTIAGRDVVGFDIATGRDLYSWRKKADANGPRGTPVMRREGIKQEDPSA
jgi:RNA polymerase sigma factor (sigma-70 family)